MVRTIPFQLVNAPRPLDGLLDLPAAPGPHPVALLVHGFKGFMEWGFWPPFAAQLASLGIAAVRVNLSGTGMRPGDDLVTDQAAFRADTLGRQLADLMAVLSAIGDGSLSPELDPQRVALLGHSRGGGVSLLLASGVTGPDVPPSPTAIAATGCQLTALLTWSAIGTVDRVSEADKAVWRAAGELPVDNARTGQRVAMGVALLDELERAGANYDLLAAAARRSVPWLLVHGTTDPTVPFAEGERLADAAAEPAWFQRIEGGDHTFATAHPFVGFSPQLAQVFAASTSFLTVQLRP